MSMRRKGREHALQCLFQHDLTGSREHTPEAGSETDSRDLLSSRQFADQLVDGVIGHLDVIDDVIRSCAENWSLDRMAVVDRNILRMAVYELLYLKDIPPRVSLDEAIEISKKYGGAESSSLINGILDHVLREADQLLDKRKDIPGEIHAGNGSV